MPVGSIFGASSEASGQQQAAQLEYQYLEQALQQQQAQYQQSRTDQAPWLQAGQQALGQYANLYNGKFNPSQINNILQSTPDYQFALTQGIRGVDAGAAATGGLDSGATRKAEEQYGANLGSQTFNNYANRLANIAGLGQSSAQSLGSLGQQNANAQTGIYGDIGTSLGSSAINQGNIWGNLYSGLGQQLGGGGFGSSSYGGGGGFGGLSGLGSFFGI